MTLSKNDIRHGTATGYSYHKCGCDKCKEFNTLDASKRKKERAKNLKLNKTLKHGTVNAYKNYSCRCKKCKKANAQKTMEERNQRRHIISIDRSSDKTVPHDTVSGYIYHKCRCKKCKKAWSTYGKSRR